MKIKHLMLGAILTASVALGVGVAVGATNIVPEVNEVDAATPSSYTKVYRFTVPSTFGNTLYVHAWGSSGHDTTWGNFLKVTDYSFNENDEKVFTLCTSGYTYTGFDLIQYNDNPNWSRSNDITVGTNTAWSWTPSDNYNYTTATPWTPSNVTFYLYDYTNMFGGNAKCYAWQSNGSLNNGAYPGVSMTKVQYGSGQLYSISLDPAFDEAIFGIGDSANTGDVWLNHNRGQTYCWWKAGDGSWSNDMNWVKAHDWIYQTMHVRDIPTSSTTDTGACKGSSGYYQKAKTAYNSFSAAIKTKISQDECFNIATERFSAWARANGETATVSGTTITVNALHVPTIMSENTNTVTIVIIATALIAAAGVGGFFLLRKRKQEN